MSRVESFINTYVERINRYVDEDFISCTKQGNLYYVSNGEYTSLFTEEQVCGYLIGMLYGYLYGKVDGWRS